jgi:hypothetical protein
MRDPNPRYKVRPDILHNQSRIIPLRNPWDVLTFYTINREYIPRRGAPTPERTAPGLPNNRPSNIFRDPRKVLQN